MKWFCLFLITFSASHVLHIPAQKFFIVWNVGQGQWTTAVTPNACYHFDMGGEFFPMGKILQQCRLKANLAFLSHWDWDHVGGLQKVKKNLPLCIGLRPLGPASKKKRRLLAGFSDCDKKSIPELYKWQPRGFKNANEQSQVILYNQVLLPGDSPGEHEKQWLDQSWISRTKHFILGHHGSNTSTSMELLKRLPDGIQAISSARWARYKHPHSSVELRLSQARIPLLRTEDWGNIWIDQ
ncbi:ComEC/Rec2 family competence protein [Bdellovibrio reynosensis]|uniref:Hydrolase n=1 Tax=Bdellovibrio reynosensis TaxID=2835041 RepID=A0ABY4C9P4_9BACT|nr:hydrolase [Bdellovibrio reynosensis]UOF01650.1 hydrolase [Bdellovibrio reynosensis]